METVSTRQPSLSPQDQRPAGGLPSKLGPRSPRRTSLEDARPAAAANRTLARGLAWFSIGLGLAQLVAPRAVCRAVGARDHEGVMRALGAREVSVGLGLLAQPDEPAWLWARVAGDAVDLALLGAAFATADRGRANLAIAATAVAGIAALDLHAGRQASARAARRPGRVRGDGSIRVQRSIAINRSPDECYGMWRDFERLPRFMRHLVSVEPAGANRWHWIARGPGGTRVEWDAEVTNDQPGDLLAWRSVEGADVDNAGAVRFLRDGSGRGTIVAVDMQYKPPAGALGAAVARLFGEEPQVQVREDLRRFKRLIEAGELPTTEGQPHGTRPVWYRMAEGGSR